MAYEPITHCIRSHCTYSQPTLHVTPIHSFILPNTRRIYSPLFFTVSLSLSLSFSPFCCPTHLKGTSSSNLHTHTDTCSLCIFMYSTRIFTVAFKNPSSSATATAASMLYGLCSSKYTLSVLFSYVSPFLRASLSPTLSLRSLHSPLNFAREREKNVLYTQR